eukprot:g41315.t1
MNIVIECKRVTDLDPSTVDWAVELTKTNMQTMYEQSEWGWKDREKKEEMTDERAWYLVAREGDSAVPTAFSHFRFDVECGEEVLYWYSCVILNDSPQRVAAPIVHKAWREGWPHIGGEANGDLLIYEVQLESRVRRKGLGKFLMQILQLLANSTQMKKVMLTVFKHNHGAYQFFKEAMHIAGWDSIYCPSLVFRVNHLAGCLESYVGQISGRGCQFGKCCRGKL